MTEQRIDQVGIIGSPSSTAELTIDIVEQANSRALLGDMVYTTHPAGDGEYMVALGTVTEIETRNRWHEDPNMRGVLRVHGTLPHLSADGDVRTAKVRVQAVYRADNTAPPFAADPVEDGGALGMSPTTGAAVCTITEPLVQGLVARHSQDLVYLGRIYRTDVRLPMFIRNFNERGSDGAYHTGIFGRNGSGKTVLAARFMAMQLRFADTAMLVFDPQGQFTDNARDLPVKVHDIAAAYGHPVELHSIAENVQLPKNAPLLVDLVQKTDFFRLLSFKRKENRESMEMELVRLITDQTQWDQLTPDALLREVLTDLLGDQAALDRIYAPGAAQNRFTAAMQSVLGDDSRFRTLLHEFAPPHGLFRRDGRTPVLGIINRLVGNELGPRPLTVLDLSAPAGVAWLDHDGVRARIMSVVMFHLRRVADETWHSNGGRVNCSVVFDEAHRFASEKIEDPDVQALSHRITRDVRETRKLGIGWTFITQQVKSLSPTIFAQLRIKAFGYGLTSGADLDVLRDELADARSLELYRSFADPSTRSSNERVYPFMLTGPVSPLSVTATPVFLQTYTEETEFWTSNSIPGA
jgi:hypothetical protein